MCLWILSHGCSTPRWFWRLALSALVAVALVAEGSRPASAAAPPEPLVRLSGHVLDSLQNAKPLPPSPGEESELLTLTLTLKRRDQAGFDRYLQNVYDKHSPRFRHFLSQRELTARFGPPQKAYDEVLAYLLQDGFTLAQGSANRLTLTVHGTRAQAERAFHLGIGNYSFQNRTFYANDRNPGLPPGIAGTWRPSTDFRALLGPQRAGRLRTGNATVFLALRGQEPRF